jgi:ADP-heptose:LPS heptosyltransferase
VLLERFPDYFDEFVDFPGFPGFPEQPFAPSKTLSFLSAMHAHHFDLLLQMQGNGTITNPLLMLCGARYYAGFYRQDTFQPNEAYFLIYPEAGSEIHRHLGLMAHLGIASQGDELEYPLYAADYRAYAQLNWGLIRGRYVIVHPGSRAQVRRWDPQLFARLGDRCAAAGYTVVLTGVESERPFTAAVGQAMTHPVLDTTGQTSLGVLGVLVQGAKLVICNDTGISHVAAALKTPSVVLALAHDIERWGPLDRSRHRVIDRQGAQVFEAALTAVQEQLSATGSQWH